MDWGHEMFCFPLTADLDATLGMINRVKIGSARTKRGKEWVRYIIVTGRVLYISAVKELMQYLPL